MTASARIATASHILYDQDIVDGFGHVSQRDPGNPDQFLLSRNMAPALVRPADVLTFDMQGEETVADGPRLFVERFIHAAIYRLRPDVQAVVHSHVPAILPFGTVPGLDLCPICHMSGFIRRGAPIHDIRDDLGPGSDMLIRSLALGENLARALGDHPLVLMRGHGMTVVGTSLEQAVYRSIYTAVNARIQLTASRIGSPDFLTELEAQATDAANQSQLGRAWEFWALRAKVAVAPLHAAMAGEE